MRLVSYNKTHFPINCLLCPFLTSYSVINHVFLGMVMSWSINLIMKLVWYHLHLLKVWLEFVCLLTLCLPSFPLLWFFFLMCSRTSAMKWYTLELFPWRLGNICSPLVLHGEQNVLPGLPYKLIMEGLLRELLRGCSGVHPSRTESLLPFQVGWVSEIQMFSPNGCLLWDIRHIPPCVSKLMMRQSQCPFFFPYF